MMKKKNNITIVLYYPVEKLLRSDKLLLLPYGVATIDQCGAVPWGSRVQGATEETGKISMKLPFSIVYWT